VPSSKPSSSSEPQAKNPSHPVHEFPALTGLDRDGAIDLADPEATAPMLALCDTLGTRVPAFSQGRAE